jgi:hypothetical protein
MVDIKYKIKKLTNFKLFLNKLNKNSFTYLNLIQHNNNFYINNCCHDIPDKLALRNPQFIIIDKNNKYDVLKIIYISNIEYISNLSNYNIDLNKNKDKTLIYDKKYQYRLYAIISDNIEIYELVSNLSSAVIKPPKTINATNTKTETELKKYITKINKIIKDLKENDLKKIAKCLMNDLLYIKDFFNKKSLIKTDYIKLIKKIYPYYINLNKYKIDKLKKLYEFDCKTIKLKYNNNSCYIDSLLVALFNSKNPIVEQIILNSPLNEIENKKDAKLIEYAEKIRDELKSLYINISVADDKTNAGKLRLLLQKYYNRYKSKINTKYSDIEFTCSQNDIGEILNFLNIIFNFPLVLKFSSNNNIEKRGFFDINNDINFYTDDDIYIKHYYPKYTNVVELADENLFRIDKYEYLSTPMLFIQLNRINNMEKKDNKIIPELKIKLKENQLYLNSIIIHQGYDYEGGHYICLYECKGIWYEFDDMRGYNVKIGSFKDVLSNENYTRNIVGLFYIEI